MVYYITGALICSTLYFVCCGAAASSNVGREYKGKQYSEVVFPRRVTRRGDFISHFLPNTYKRVQPQRYKRSLGENIHYLVPFRGTNYHLELTPNHQLISPGMVIENHRKRISERSINHANETQCHYTGFIRGDKNSKVAISTCNGLTGYIRTKRQYFFIEPIPGHTPSNTKAHPHFVNSHSIQDHFVVNCESDANIAEVIAKRAARYEREGEVFKCISELHIETLVVVDRTMLMYHKEIDVENYVLTVFNMAHDLYHDASLATNINLAIVRLIRLEQEDHEVLRELGVLLPINRSGAEDYANVVFNLTDTPVARKSYHKNSPPTFLIKMMTLRLFPHDNRGAPQSFHFASHCVAGMNIAINKDAAKTLEYFREWQNSINPKEDSHPNHHDVAILLTRIDICGSDNSCGLLGASKIGGMCDPHNQAAVCEDDGLRLGFVIAHELGHTLAMLHDTLEDSGCNSTFDGNLTTVMDPFVTIDTAGWSPCSNKFLEIFVDSGFGKCMYDTPTEHSFHPVDILPGVMYDGNFQCKELLGPNSALCMTGIECDNLICYVEDKGCVETHTGVAPGTSCGEKMWCIRGECIEIGDRLEAIDGGWGTWSDWSECTRTCGSGVAMQERHCENPRPKNGGKYCEGDHIRHKICATEPCDVNQPSFRDVQCAEFDSWVYPEDGTVHTWKNYPMPDENPCVLFCINDFGDIASLRPRVIDGTSCQRGVRDVCINGMCQEIPCDLDLESNAVEDACGVCRGDSTSCDLMMGEIQIPCCGRIVEERLMEIPAQAINIKLEEVIPSESRIQIRNCGGEMVYVFGNVFGTFNVPGSLAWMGNVRPKQEAVRIPGPITDAISIWVVVSENVTIRFSYGVPTTKKRKPKFYWDFIRWKRCSADCGPGIQESFPSCVEKIGGEVDDQYCKNLHQPNVQIRSCEIAPCVTRWFVGDWQACNKCPKGKRIRIVKCVRPTGQGEGEVIFVSDSQCVGPKPKSKEPCICAVNSTSPPKKRDVSVDDAGRVVVESPEGAKAKTKEKLDVDSEGNIMKAKEEVFKNATTITVNDDHHPQQIEMTTTNSATSVRHTNTSSTVASKVLTQPLNDGTGDLEKNNGPDSEECKNVSLANQYKDIKVNISAPHCPTNVEYDEELYCNETNLEESMNASEGPHFVNLTTCIVLSVAEVDDEEDNSTTYEDYATEPINLNETLSTCAPPQSILNANSSSEMCSKLSSLIGQTVLDKEPVDNISLTIHSEVESGKRPVATSLRGKAALEFMDEMQKDFENNKTKIK